jgi:hypothetical protein
MRKSFPTETEMRQAEVTERGIMGLIKALHPVYQRQGYPMRPNEILSASFPNPSDAELVRVAAEKLNQTVSEFIRTTMVSRARAIVDTWDLKQMKGRLKPGLKLIKGGRR